MTEDNVRFHPNPPLRSPSLLVKLRRVAEPILYGVAGVKEARSAEINFHEIIKLQGSKIWSNDELHFHTEPKVNVLTKIF